MKKITPKTTEKHVTEKLFLETLKNFENNSESNMRSVAKSFERVEGVLDVILKEIKNNNEQHKEFKNSITVLNGDGISYERRIDNLTTRVEKLESKSK
ncbi:MAG: hypothetical protein WC011_01165 [Candidatus Paceibacterota bacterium]